MLLFCVVIYFPLFYRGAIVWGAHLGPSMLPPTFVTPQPLFSRPHYVKLYEAECGRENRGWGVTMLWKVGMPPKHVFCSRFCLTFCRNDMPRCQNPCHRTNCRTLLPGAFYKYVMIGSECILENFVKLEHFVSYLRFCIHFVQMICDDAQTHIIELIGKLIASGIQYTCIL